MSLKHIINTSQFLNKKVLEEIFKEADLFKKNNGIAYKILAGKLLASVFYEPSTRTRFSFEAAMLKLGGEVITTEAAEHFSSVTKGETLEDTIKVISGYADAIVLRHPEIGSAQKASKVSDSPIINAGDGSGEHPTQALLDIYTIKSELKDLSNFKIALVGDLLYGRTIHSLIQFFSVIKPSQIFLISPKELKLPPKYKKFLKENKVNFSETDNLAQVLAQIDVLYMTRVQKERFASQKLYNKIKDQFVLDKKLLSLLPRKSVIMHPLPRVNEISADIDKDKRAAYFRQAKNGLFVRMALLKKVLAK